MQAYIQILLLVCSTYFQNTGNFKFINKIEIKADFISTDQFKNTYVVSKNEIRKITPTDNSIVTYSNTLTGQIKSVDTSDPFRTMLYYNDFNIVVFLDNKLVEITSPIHLNDLGFYTVGAVCTSINNGFWIFDLDLLQLVYIDKNRNQTQKSSNLQGILGSIDPVSKILMFEKNEFIYLGINGKGVFQFDSYGTFIKLFPIKDINHFQVVDSTIIYMADNEIKIYNTLDYDIEAIPLPEKNVKQCRLEGTTIFLLTNNRISLYNIEKLNTNN